MENCIALEVPPPGLGVTTVTCAVPGFAIRLAGTGAVKNVASWLVGRGMPFQSMTDAAIKPDPSTRNVNAAPPGGALEGTRPVITGVGLCSRTVVSWLPELLLRFASAWFATTRTALVMVPGTVGVRLYDNVTVAPLTSVPRLQAITVLGGLHVPWLGTGSRKGIKPTGSVLISDTPVAGSGPWFVTTMLYVTALFWLTGSGVPEIVTLTSALPFVVGEILATKPSSGTAPPGFLIVWKAPGVIGKLLEVAEPVT